MTDEKDKDKKQHDMSHDLAEELLGSALKYFEDKPIDFAAGYYAVEMLHAAFGRFAALKQTMSQGDMIAYAFSATACAASLAPFMEANKELLLKHTDRPLKNDADLPQINVTGWGEA